MKNKNKTGPNVNRTDLNGKEKRSSGEQNKDRTKHG